MLISKFVIDKKSHKLTINFSTNDSGDIITLSFEYLRVNTPVLAASNKKSIGDDLICHKKDVRLLAIESVAKHGYRLIFDDGHQAIYSEKYLHILALEYETRWAKYIGDLSASGKSREALIEFTQL